MNFAVSSGEIHPSAFPSAQYRYVPGCRPTLPAARLRAPLRYCGGRLSRLKSVIPTRRLRNSEVVLILISAVIGAVVGLGVVLLHDFVGYLHHVVFGLGEGRYLSEGVGIAPATMVLAPALGGLLVGTLMFFVRRWRPGDIVDPIEANALFGGKMSLIDSFRLTVSTVISNALRRFGRDGGGLYPDRLGPVVGAGADDPAAPRRSAHSDRVRRRGGHSGGLQRAAGRGVLRLRTGDRQLYAGGAGSRRRGGPDRDPRGAGHHRGGAHLLRRCLHGRRQRRWITPPSPWWDSRRAGSAS